MAILKTPDQITEAEALTARRMLFSGGIVLTLDAALGEFACADLLIEDGKIVSIQPKIRATDENILAIDASNRILLPGFVDTHCHSYQGLLRGLLPNGLVLPDYDRDVQKTITPHYDPEDAYFGVLITALGMLNMGTTTMVDISQVAHSPEHIEAVIQALADSGLRAVFSYWRGSGPRANYPRDIFRILPKYFNSGDQLLTPALAVAPDEASFKVARQAGLRAIAHVRLNPEPILKLRHAGLIEEGDEFIHCTHLTDDAWRVIKDSGARTSHSPPLEMAMGHGMPSIQEALDAGLRPSLSCDHCATVGQDMFGVMRTTFNLQRLSSLQRTRNGEAAAPQPLACREVLEFATIEGAKCANLDRKTGSLSPGKEADFIVMRADNVDVWPLNNAYAAVVNLMNPSHVESVFVAGKARKWNGRLAGVDVPKALNSVARSRDAVLDRANFKRDLLA
jgi:cytosine/adenosine deaminase-related metal-dependent hydrolase